MVRSYLSAKRSEGHGEGGSRPEASSIAKAITVNGNQGKAEREEDDPLEWCLSEILSDCETSSKKSNVPLHDRALGLLDLLEQRFDGSRLGVQDHLREPQAKRQP